MEIIASAILVLVVYFFIDYKSKVNKLEKRVEALENKVEND